MSANKNAPQHGDAAGRYEHDGLDTDSTRPNTERPTAADMFAGPEDVRDDSAEATKGGAPTDENPFDNDKARERAEKSTEEEHRRRNTFYSVAEVAAQTAAPRARRQAQNIERSNLTRDVKYPPKLVVTGEELVTAHVPAAEVDALTPITYTRVLELKTEEREQQRAAQYDALVQERLQWKLADQEATKRLRALDTFDAALPPVTGLADLLAQDDTEVRYLIQDVIPADGARIMFAAPEKAGKTTLLGNLARSLADGDPFLGAFEVHTPAKRLVMIDNEMSQGMLRRWLRRQGIRNLSAVADVVALRGQAGLFDLGDDRRRGEWAKRLRDLGCDFLIFDCLRPVLDALGLDENREAGKFLEPFDQLLSEAGVENAVIAHHMGHTGERARGDSRIIGWSDGNWKLVREDPYVPTSPKYFTSQVRDCPDVPEGLLTFDPDTQHLTYAGGTRAEQKGKGKVDKRLQDVLDTLADSQSVGTSEMNKTQLRAAVGGNKELVDGAIDEGVRLGLVVERLQGRAKLYRLPEGDPLSAEGVASPFETGNTA
ncbi:ATP-binding protein [Rhodococcus sp. AB351]|uniref:ATP-binding protein n=1 Tax=Rhodococcus sp. AB351 TaxID=3413280 RepID=UPI003C1E54AF